MKGYCQHFREHMDLEDCFFCFFKLHPLTSEQRLKP
jgi:Zn-finger protein